MPGYLVAGQALWNSGALGLDRGFEQILDNAPGSAGAVELVGTRFELLTEAFEADSPGENRGAVDEVFPL